MKPYNLVNDPIWAIYKGLAAEAVEKIRNYYKPTRRIRASEISNCRRQIWYRLSGYIPFPKKPWLELVGNSGDFHHDYVRYLMHQFEMGLSGIKFGDDIVTDTGAVIAGSQEEDENIVRTYTFDDTTFDLSCRADGSQDIGLPDETALLEVKTMTSFKFDKLQKEWIAGGNEGAFNYLLDAKPSYIWQGNQSAMLLEKRYVYLLCIDRNLNRIGLSDTPVFGKDHVWDPLAGKRAGGVVWEVEQDDHTNILRKAADVVKHVESGKAPSPEFVSKSEECQQCDFYIYCHGAKQGLQYPIPGVLR